MKTRRFELDWLRVLVFGFLILYHVSMYFNPWGWHIKSTETYDWMRLPLLSLNQWRLEILFLISGMGTYFSLRKRTKGQYGWERFWRLGLPLFIGMLIIIPPQVYIERVTNEGLNISYWEFYTTIAFKGIYPNGNLSWHHLWFLPYLLCYSLLLIPFLGFFNSEKFRNWKEQIKLRLQSNPWLIYLLILPIIVVEFTLSPFFPVNHGLLNDWFAFTHYFLLFFFGFAFMQIHKSFFNLCYGIRRKTLLMAAVAFGAEVLCFPYMSMGIINSLQSIFEIIYMWSVTLAVFGFAVQYLSRDSKYLKPLNEAVYPFYIFHQTVLIVAIYQFKEVFNSDLGFFFFLIIATTLGSWILFEIVRRVNFLRPLFGLKGKFRTASIREANLNESIPITKTTFKTD